MSVLQAENIIKQFPATQTDWINILA